MQGGNFQRRYAKALANLSQGASGQSQHAQDPDRRERCPEEHDNPKQNHALNNTPQA